MSIKSFTNSYSADLHRLLGGIDFEVLDRISGALEGAARERKTVFLAGNGGSAAIASHFANDLNKLSSVSELKFRALALTDNVPLLTAWANDTDFSEVFAKQLENFVEEGDLVLVISSSGNSPNIVKVLAAAKAKKASTAALTGFTGGTALKAADLAIHVDADHYGLVEDCHQILCHVLANYLRERLCGEKVEASGEATA